MLPAGPGTYLLVLKCSSTRTMRIGSLGTVRLRPVFYLYIGSALGLGGLRARIGHHRERAVRPYWHIDYLRRYARLESAWYYSGAQCEHAWAAQVGAMPGATEVLRGFGSSDCSCPTHLYWFAEEPENRGILLKLRLQHCTPDS